MVITNELEWQMLSYYVIYEKFWKIMQQAEKEALRVNVGQIRVKD